MLKVLVAAFGKLYGHCSRYLLSFTVCRLILVAYLLPVYVIKTIWTILPTVILNLPWLLTSSARAALVKKTEEYRKSEQSMADLQLEGNYRFPKEFVFPISRDGKGWMHDQPFSMAVKDLSVCGVTARYVHLQPKSHNAPGGNGVKRPIVFLHGNPSWSFIWRSILSQLIARGHEVYALDWIGHGRSDKVIRRTAITFELHMRTLIQFFEVTGLKDVVLVAHDWGGCIALCTFSHLPPNSCHRIFLLNSFLPPRSTEMEMHYMLLYMIWFLSTGIMGGYLPEAGVMRYMSPHLSQEETDGYSAPYSGLPVSTKASVFCFGHMVPGFPRSILRHARNTRLWKLLEGLCGPVHFSSLNAQARLAERDDSVRPFWSTGGHGGAAEKDSPRVLVVFGEDDPLLKSYMDILGRTIHPKFTVDWAPTGIWLPNAGHYATEEKATEVLNLIGKFSTSE